MSERVHTRVREGAFGPFLDLSDLFPGDLFAYVALRGFAGTDPATLAAFLGDRGHGEVRVCTVRQVHSARLAEPRDAPCEADGIVVREAGFAARVLVADCVPVLLARGDGSAWAAVHAGWKGTLAGISAKAATSLMGTEGARLVAYVGPAVGPCCYAVPAERREAFEGAFPGLPREAFGPPGRLDLSSLNAAQLEAVGVGAGDLRREACCTACSPAICWSYRRDGDSAGRMAALVGRPRDSVLRPG